MPKQDHWVTWPGGPRRASEAAACWDVSDPYLANVHSAYSRIYLYLPERALVLESQSPNQHTYETEYTARQIPLWEAVRYLQDAGLCPDGGLPAVVTRIAGACGRAAFADEAPRLAGSPLLLAGVPSPQALEVVADGFDLAGRWHPLTGRPLHMLRLLHAAGGRCLTADRLRQEMHVNDEHVNNPDQVIRDTASALRAALRKALGWGRDRDPLPSRGSGAHLTYRLDLPHVGPIDPG